MQTGRGIVSSETRLLQRHGRRAAAASADLRPGHVLAFTGKHQDRGAGQAGGL